MSGCGEDVSPFQDRSPGVQGLPSFCLDLHHLCTALMESMLSVEKLELCGGRFLGRQLLEWMELLTYKARLHCSCARQLPAAWPQPPLEKTIMSIC